MKSAQFYLWTAVFAIAVAPLLVGCKTGPRAMREETHNLEHIAGSAIEIESRNGRIEIVGEPKREDVMIKADIRAGGRSTSDAEDRLSRARLDIVRDTSGTLIISAVFPEPHHSRDSASITVHAPDAASARLTTSNARVTARGLDASLTVNTSNGRITVTDWNGDAELTTSNSRVNVSHLTGTLTVRSSNGRVQVEDLGGPADIRTSNGRIALTLRPDVPGPIDLRTSNSRITAEVGPAFAGTLTMQTSNSSLTLDDAASIITERETGRRRKTLIFSEDGAESQVRTSNGSIVFRTRK